MTAQLPSNLETLSPAEVFSDATKDNYLYLTTQHRAKMKSNEWSAA